jgi:hypothetical protein
MHRTIRAAIAAFALLVLPQLASAGPIQWGYRAVDPNGTVLAEKTGLTDLFWSDFFLPDPLTHGVVVPDPIPNNNIRTDIKRSEATVTITDETSGETGTFWLYSDYRWQYEIKADGSLEPIHEGQTGGPYPDYTNLVLGGNTYSLRAPGGEFMAQVTPTPVPTAVTPEPGTLVLAMCGLGALSWRIRRRVIA